MMRLGLLWLAIFTDGKPAKRLEYFRVPKTGSTWMMYYFTRTRNCSGLALHDHGKGCGDPCDAGRCGDPKSCNASLVGRDAAVLAVARDPVSQTTVRLPTSRTRALPSISSSKTWLRSRLTRRSPRKRGFAGSRRAPSFDDLASSVHA